MAKPRAAAAVADDVVLTIHEVAQRLHTTTEVLRKWRYENRGPESFRLAGKVVYLQSAVAAYVEAERSRTARGGTRGTGRSAI